VVARSYKARMTALAQGSWELRNSIALSPIQTLTFRRSTSSRSSLLGLKKGILFGGTSTRAPVFGLRPMRARLARVEPSESADFNLVAGSQGMDDAVKYGANDGVGFLPGHLGGLTNLFSQVSPGHQAHPRCITKKSITVFLGAPGRRQLQQGRPLVKWAGTVMWAARRESASYGVKGQYR
jgi:hypothetical protein